MSRPAAEMPEDFRRLLGVPECVPCAYCGSSIMVHAETQFVVRSEHDGHDIWMHRECVHDLCADADDGEPPALDPRRLSEFCRKVLFATGEDLPSTDDCSQVLAEFYPGSTVMVGGRPPTDRLVVGRGCEEPDAKDCHGCGERRDVVCECVWITSRNARDDPQGARWFWFHRGCLRDFCTHGDRVVATVLLRVCVDRFGPRCTTAVSLAREMRGMLPGHRVCA